MTSINIFLAQVNKHRPDWKGTVVAIDPGETTGVCVFKGTELVKAGQINTKNIPEDAVTLCNWISDQTPNVLVVEDYRVYKWKTDQHAWAGLHTPRLIGMVEYVAFVRGHKLVKQSAQIGKGFCTDDKLKSWGFYLPGKRHAVDAVRHACQFLMFGTE